MKKIYFNNAATSYPKAPGVAEKVRESLSCIPFHPGRSGSKADDPMDRCRVLLAEMLGIDDKNRIILTVNSTYALNFALFGFPFRKNDTVITSAAEHNSVLRPLHHLMRSGDLHPEIIPVDSGGRIIPSEYFKKLELLKPRMVVLNHASNVTGAVADVKPLFKAAKDLGAVTLLDASQSMGSISFTAESLYADMVAFTGHKSLLGPPGTGGIYVSKNVELEPVIVGGTGIRSDLLYQPEDMPTRLEAGTPSLPAFSGLAEALEWKKKNREDYSGADVLIKKLEEGIQDIAGINSIKSESPRTPVISFTLKKWSVEEAAYILQESFGIICRSGLHCAPLIHKYLGTAPHGTVRFSLSPFSTEVEVAYALEALRKLTV